MRRGPRLGTLVHLDRSDLQLRRYHVRFDDKVQRTIPVGLGGLDIIVPREDRPLVGEQDSGGVARFIFLCIEHDTTRKPIPYQQGISNALTTHLGRKSVRVFATSVHVKGDDV